MFKPPVVLHFGECCLLSGPLSLAHAPPRSARHRLSRGIRLADSEGPTSPLLSHRDPRDTCHMWDLTTFAGDRTLGSTDAQTGHSEPQWTRARGPGRSRGPRALSPSRPRASCTPGLHLPPTSACQKSILNAASPRQASPNPSDPGRTPSRAPLRRPARPWPGSFRRALPAARPVIR